MAILSLVFTSLFYLAAIATPLVLIVLIYLTFVGAQDPRRGAR